MAKLMMLFCLVLLVGGFISAEAGRVWTRPTPAASLETNCGHHGDLCHAYSSGCCSNYRCNGYEGRCQAIITADEINRARKKILGRDQPDN